MRKQLGLTLEPLAFQVKGRVELAANAGASPLGAMPVTHVGIAVTDARGAGRLLGKLLSTAAPDVGDEALLSTPPETKLDRETRVKTARVRPNGVGIDMIQSIGGSTPWSDFDASHKGNAAMILGFDVGDRMDETLIDLQAKGGRLIAGKPGGGQAYLDFMDTLGFVIEITGASHSAR